MKKISVNVKPEICAIEEQLGDILEKNKDKLEKEFGKNWPKEKFELEIHFKNGKTVNLINKEHFDLEE